MVVSGSNTKFSMETDTGSGKYEIRATRGSTRTKSIKFENLGSTAVNLKLSIDGDLAGYINLSASSVSLPLSKEIKTNVDFDLTIPADLPDGVYSTNINAVDQDGNKGFITVEVTVGKLSAPIEFLERMKSSRTLMGIRVPYFLIFVFAWIFVGFLSFQIGFKRIKSIGLFLSVMLGAVLGAILVLL